MIAIKLYEIAFVACLLSSPETCEERVVQTLDTPPTFYECFHKAMYPASEWLVDHPQWFFKKVTCGQQKIKI